MLFNTNVDKHLPERLRRIINDDRFGQIASQNRQIFDVITVDEYAVLAEKAISIEIKKNYEEIFRFINKQILGRNNKNEPTLFVKQEQKL